MAHEWTVGIGFPWGEVPIPTSIPENPGLRGQLESGVGRRPNTAELMNALARYLTLRAVFPGRESGLPSITMGQRPNVNELVGVPRLPPSIFGVP